MHALILSLTVLLAGVVALFGAYLVTRNFRLKMEQRVRAVARLTRPSAPESGARGQLDRFLSQADETVRWILSWGIGASWGTKSGSGKLLLIAAASAACAWFAAAYLIGVHHLASAVLCLVVAYLIPHRLLLKEQRNAERKFNEMFPDAVESVARMLRAGLPATAAMRSVGEESAEPIGKVFRTVSDQMRIGIPFGEALSASSEKIALPDYRFFTVSVNLQYATGGNLVFTLETLAGIIRKRRAVRTRAKALTSEIRLSAYVLGSLPFLTLGALLLIQPNYLTPLFNDPRGHIILGLASGGLLLSIITMKKMMGSVTNG